MSSGATVDLDALARLFGDEFMFNLQPGGTEVGVVLRGEQIAVVSVGHQLYPGDTLALTFGQRVYKFRCPRWSLKLRLDPVPDATT